MPAKWIPSSILPCTYATHQNPITFNFSVNCNCSELPFYFPSFEVQLQWFLRIKFPTFVFLSPMFKLCIPLQNINQNFTYSFTHSLTHSLTHSSTLVIQRLKSLGPISSFFLRTLLNNDFRIRIMHWENSLLCARWLNSQTSSSWI
jgi:hypothetical protein